MRKKKQAIDADEVELAQILGVVRVGLGAAMFFAPRLLTRLWTGEDQRETTSNLAVRGMGARDVAIGIGILAALEKGTPVRGWLEASALSDASDAVGTLTQWGDLGNVRALLLLLTELGSAWMGTQLARSLD